MKVHNNTTDESRDGSRFLDALTTIDSSEMMSQLDRGITDIISAVMDTGEKGKLTLTIEVLKSKKERQLIIKPSVKVATPSYLINSCIAYADKDATLYQDDPCQGLFDFETAPKRVVIEGGKTYQNSESQISAINH